MSDTEDLSDDEYESIIAAAVEEIKSEHCEGESVADAVFEEADAIVSHESIDKHTQMILSSDNNPEGYQPYVEGADSIEEIMQALAFVVVRSDIYDRLSDVTTIA